MARPRVAATFALSRGGGASAHGLADALDCTASSRAVKLQAQQHQPVLRSCSLDRRIEFGVKNKSSWLPLRGGGGGGSGKAGSPGEMQMEPLSEDYTCVISRGLNPRAVHIFGDRIVEGSGTAGEGLICHLQGLPLPRLPPPPSHERAGELELGGARWEQIVRLTFL